MLQRLLGRVLPNTPSAHVCCCGRLDALPTQHCHCYAVLWTFINSLQLPPASKQPPPRNSKSKRARAADAASGDEQDSEAEADGEAGEEQPDNEAGLDGDPAAEGEGGDAGAEGDEEGAAEALRKQRALRQSNGAGAFVAYMPAQLSAVSGRWGCWACVCW